MKTSKQLRGVRKTIQQSGLNELVSKMLKKKSGNYLTKKHQKNDILSH